MAMERFEYEPAEIFENEAEYPDDPGNESSFREQMSRPHKQMRIFVNKLVEKLTSKTPGNTGADNISATPLEEKGADTVQGILGELFAKIKNKVEKVDGKGLSANDFTDELKTDYDAASQKAKQLKDAEGVDAVLTESEKNLPTSKAVSEAIKNRMNEIGAGDMPKSTYDTNNSGVVDDSERLGGKKPEDYAKTAVFVKSVITASSWDGNTYSFEQEYPSEQYDITIEPSEECSIEAFEAYCTAGIIGNSVSNIIKALGDVPIVDIPVIVKAVEK